MFHRVTLGTLFALTTLGLPWNRNATAGPEPEDPPVAYRTVKIEGVDIFFREAGPKDAPVILLLHGFPSSSHMFRNLIPRLADKYHVVAPDFPGYGQSSAPPVDRFEYTYAHFTDVIGDFTQKLGLKSYALYLQDIGSSVGYRLAVKHPERVTALVIQNGEAYVEGINKEFFKPLEAYWKGRTEENEKTLRGWLLTVEGTRWHYVHGARNAEAISPDNWTIDQAFEDRPGNKEIQLAILYDTQTNLALYATWQAYFRKHQPPTLVVWGKNDSIFTVEGARRLSETGKLPADITGQAELAWEHVIRMLERAGMTVADVVKVTQYLTRAEDIPAYVEVRSRFLDDVRPAFMLAVVSQLVRPGILVEVEIIAAKD